MFAFDGITASSVTLFASDQLVDEEGEQEENTDFVFAELLDPKLEVGAFFRCR